MVDKTFSESEKIYFVDDIVNGCGSREGFRGIILAIEDDIFLFWKRKKYFILWNSGAYCWHYDTDFE